MLTIFRDVNGPILVHFQEKGQTVTSARYSDMLVNELKPAIDRNVGDFSQKFVKGHAKKLFSRGHPQACGQVGQVCCEAGGLCLKIRHKQFL
jgi:hypothetical protein